MTTIKEINSSLQSLFEPELVEEMHKHGSYKEFKTGETLLDPGSYIRSTMIVLDGALKVVRENTDDEGEFFLYYIKPVEACALSLMCASSYKPSLVRVHCEQDTTALVVPLEVTETWLGKYPSWLKFVIQSYRGRFDEVLNTLDQVAFSALDERLEFYLKRIAQTQQTNKISITHQSIAKDLNSSREVISRLLKKMQQKGMIEMKRNELELLYL